MSTHATKLPGRASERPRRTASSLHVVGSIGPGLLVTVAIASVATLAGRTTPIVGSPVIAIVIGGVLSGWVRRHPRLRAGTNFAGRTILQVAVVVLGAQLSLSQVTHVGISSLPVMLGTLTVCLVVAYLLGRRFGIERDLRTLIGVGTAICGASAIAAVSPTIRAKHPAVAYAVSTIFLFNIAAVLCFPPLGHALGLSQHEFGLFAGSAVNDTSSVVAAATSYGSVASHYAVVVKLTRTLMIIPICLWLAALTRRRDVASGAGDAADRVGAISRAVHSLHYVPWFLVGFLAVAAANSAGLIPASSHNGAQTLALFLVTVALAGIGTSVDVAALRKAGPKPLLLGGALWIVVASTSLLLQTIPM